MKLLVAISLFFLGASQCHAATEQFAGITCPTLGDAQTVSQVAQSYSLTSTIEMRTHCLFMVFEGEKVGETADFSIGSELHSFLIVRHEGYTLYVLTDKGNGYSA